ncbi:MULTISPECIES: YkoF family thiamine/hydroxymethylpyrimidine-binding protein [unclassified Actinobaculum]|uniref:YkoF family thiamine/hydroxymethylpyrimidine-binding protein n=1 Tax=unclassified Actinobaculum TaxID=2609299 RepID=UPI000D526034|nr:MULTISPECIES: YkoF family thiamine/hydroxymethylpyrimidine-binding protein [unclassified Actinobaculum]AWE43093.1 hypothetical protein DDD63_10475 [Actinobaculum sp. 313]RTE48521.1 hypothetical protein EKN07_09140 [Actinobaculum sp. 352]
MSPKQPAAIPTTVADPLAFGVGARITAAIMSDHFADQILSALAQTDATGLVVETGDVSTYLGGEEATLLRYVTDLAEAIAATGAHASITLLLSRGCPGEVACSTPGRVSPRVVDTPSGRVTGRYATAEWTLYPLADTAALGGTPDHMRDIAKAIDIAKESGVFRGSHHFVTRLAGDIGTILASVFAAWVHVGNSVQHVTSHLTLSLNSPSHTTDDISPLVAGGTDV